MTKLCPTCCQSLDDAPAFTTAKTIFNKHKDRVTCQHCKLALPRNSTREVCLDETTDKIRLCAHCERELRRQGDE